MAFNVGLRYRQPNLHFFGYAISASICAGRVFLFYTGHGAAAEIVHGQCDGRFIMAIASSRHAKRPFTIDAAGP